jgi:hypothetical protein
MMASFSSYNKSPQTPKLPTRQEDMAKILFEISDPKEEQDFTEFNLNFHFEGRAKLKKSGPQAACQPQINGTF